ncbi:MAG: L-serine ammonia-lyase, iron-sulfur-dependent, subunit alpha [Halodesulfovibrio sp.]|uniref:L-serine ammonia-lyase, iron-sulfur-dependent, subunit alpha n=1 Tax=Halodesulfovibrio sp. TaxID=1912772 RepID=UPI00359CCAEE
MSESATPVSIFNEVIGPVMRGCSSSHVAASLRIGLIARDCVNGAPLSASVTFDSKEALAYSYDGQGSAMGFVGGLLGYTPDSALLPDAQARAAELGIPVRFLVDDIPTTSPNTYLITVEEKPQDNEGAIQEEPVAITLEAVSLGGGAIEIQSIEGVSVSLRGDTYVTLLFCDCPKGIAYKALQEKIPSLQKATFSKSRSGMLHVLESLHPFTVQQQADLSNVTASHRSLFISPVMPVLANTNVLPFRTAKEMLEQEDASGLPLYELASKYECARSGQSQDQLLEMMGHLAGIMEKGISIGVSGTSYADRILQSQAPLALSLAGNPLIGGAMQRIISYVAALMDCKSAMEVIVAAPTAGACGVLGGAVWAAAHELEASPEEVAKALLAAGIIGVFIADKATFAGEEGGCQVECGSGSAMAAAALVQLSGGTAQQAVDAAALALQNVLGLVCDTICDRVEFPCMGRNIMAAVNALACSGMATAGFTNVIPLDETIAAMREVVNYIPLQLRCTGLGGLAQTPTAQRLSKTFVSSSGSNS